LCGGVFDVAVVAQRAQVAVAVVEPVADVVDFQPDGGAAQDAAMAVAAQDAGHST
jgi:hypothetical protein